jgi:hypothetical protein
MLNILAILMKFLNYLMNLNIYNFLKNLAYLINYLKMKITQAMIINYNNFENNN